MSRPVYIILFIKFLLLLCCKCYAHELIIGAGDFEVKRNTGKIMEFRAEYRGEAFLWKFKPLIGGLLTTKLSKFIYVGVALSHHFDRNFSGGVSFAPGYYSKGKGKNLGCWLELKSQLELWYKAGKDWKIGIAASHLSNAKIRKKNPGQESLILQISRSF